MLLYLIRHADAVPAGSGGVKTDSERYLSEQGIRETKELVGGLGEWFNPTLIGHSALKRAQQTAEIIAQTLGETRRASLVPCDAMNPGGQLKHLIQFLRDSPNSNIALVGHNPDVESHAARLIGSKKAHVAFAKGAIACIEFEGVPAKKLGILTWLVSPGLRGSAGKA